ncbi:MAG: sensor domain-containing diguanylate cyclase, partial [Miltoncostaeaceae bacterium]
AREPGAAPMTPDDDLGAALARIADAARAALGAERATCYAYEVTTGTVGSVHTTESDPAVRGLIERAAGRPAARFPLWQAQRENRDPLMLIEDTSADARIPATVVDKLRAASLIAVRLEHHDVGARPGAEPTVLGALYCSFGGRRRFRAHECSVARSLASLASLALGHAHMRVQTTRNLQRVRALEAEQAALRRVATQVAEVAGGAGDVHSLVAREARSLLDVDAALVARFDGAGAVVEGAAGDQFRAGDHLALGGAGCLATVARTGSYATVPDYAALEATAPVRGHALHHGFRAGTAVPVRVDGRLWGGILATTCDRDGIRDGAADSLQRFADLVGLTIANAEARATLVQQAMRDPLTGLANSRTFFERLEAERRRAARHGRPLSLVVFDLDGFKRINDTYGHPAGDRVLVEFATRVRMLTRTDDTLGRTGGEEFAWLIPEAGADEAHTAAERARRAIGERPFPVAGTVTVSAGVATIAAEGSARGLFEAADAAMYDAKRAGRNTVRDAPSTGPGPPWAPRRAGGADGTAGAGGPGRPRGAREAGSSTEDGRAD